MLSFNKIIYNQLVNSSELNLITSSFFPIVVPESTNTPFIVYKRTNYFSNYSKDGCTNNNFKIEFNCLSDSYATSLDIIEILRKIFEFKTLIIENQKIKLTINSATEDYDGLYIQTIIFDVTHYQS